MIQFKISNVSHQKIVIIKYVYSKIEHANVILYIMVNNVI